MKLPSWTSVEMTVSGLRAALVGLAFLVVTGFATVQTMRLEGLHAWPISITGWIKTAEDRQATIDKIRAAQELADAKARAAKLAAEKTYSDIAERIDDDANRQIDTAMDAAERFIAAGGAPASRRVQCPATRSSPGRTASPAGGDRAGNGEAAGRAAELDAAGDEFVLPDGYVLVPAEDVRICTRNTLQAEAARRWALDLEAASRAEPAPD